ncbi:MAG: GspE/PulE family protein, partial [Myxococcota bacterium]|nr:GspE/PulE family protein [Myxococcota bacterium]
TLPVAFGEKVVVRIFDPQILLQDLEGLGLTDGELDRFTRFLARPHGLLLVTGPTGSGKTTTLYSALQDLATGKVNVTTIEDPIEMVVEEFNQTAVHPRIGITFASALRTILRQDPDVIMVGEIRDGETASQAIQAALTGHLVLSTLHTNDSVSAITRLVDLGVEPFLVASTVVGVVAQRLVRTICESCRTEIDLSEAQATALGLETATAERPRSVAAGKGCVDCRFTGLSGRRGLFELLPVTTAVQGLITDSASGADILKTARDEGLRTLRESAVECLIKGQTTFEEVLRVTAESEDR